MSDDYRSNMIGGCAVLKHFDCLTKSHSLTPFRGVVADTTGQSKIGNLLVGTDGLFYGLGTDVNNPTLGDIYKKATFSGSWAELNNSKSAAAIEYTLFVEQQNYFYYWKAAYLVKCDRTGVASVNNTFQNVVWTNVRTNGVVHPKDGVLYIPYDNKIATLQTDGTTFNATALTIPDSRYVITGLTPYGNYLAIAITPVNNSPIGSQVLLWDRDSSIATVSESIDWGTGILKVLNNIDGYLIGISDAGGSSSSVLDRDMIVIKVYNGGLRLLKQVSTIKKTTTTPDAVINPRVNFIFGGKMYFSLTITGGSTSPSLNGLWSIGKNKEGQYVLSVERVATDDNSETAVLAAAIMGDYVSAVHTTEGTLTISNSETLLANIFTATSACESLIINDGDSDLTKKLIGVTVMTEPLPAAGSVVLKYRTDEAIALNTTNWTTIYTNTTDDSISHGAINIESSGANLPQYKEIQFQILSTGGAVITGLKWKSEVIDKQLY